MTTYESTAARSLRLRELPIGERPRERLAACGSAALSDSELLAIVLRSGVEGVNAVQLAQHLLLTFGGWPGVQRASLDELAGQRGIGLAKATAIKAILELARRVLLATYEERPQIKRPTDVAQLLMLEMSHLDQEHLRTVLLDTKNRVQAISTVYVGSLNTSMVRVGEVFKEAIRRNSAALILAHNHPSGAPEPSPVIWRIIASA
jgi:DNA repair protein RadC